MNGEDVQLDNCGCCDNRQQPTSFEGSINCYNEHKRGKNVPYTIHNRPGLLNLQYRIGTHNKFRASMITSLAANESLQKLTARSDDDLAIGLLDAWATVADVLTFYQERIANEGFLRTAKERMSILELARTIGYELRPGVAANTNLAFTLEDAPGAVEQTMIDIGTKVQSLPAQDETPQIFETIERIEAMPDLNELRPRLTLPQNITESTTTFYFQGVNTQLKPGDGLLVIKQQDKKIVYKSFMVVSEVKLEPELNRTLVNVVPELGPSTAGTTIKERDPIVLDPLIDEFDLAKVSTETIKEMISKKWTVSDYTAFAIKYNIKLSELFKVFNYWGSKPLSNTPETVGVYAFRIRTGLFGHNAPTYSSLPPDIRALFHNWDSDPVPINKKPHKLRDDFKTEEDKEWLRGLRKKFDGLPDQADFDRFIDSYEDYGTEYVKDKIDDYFKVDYGKDSKLIYLDRDYSSILPNTWIVLQSHHDIGWRAFEIENVFAEAVSEFTFSLRVTGLTLKSTVVNSNKVSDFKLRTTTIYAQSEQLLLAEQPNQDPIKNDTIVLDHKVDGLAVGQLVSITGEVVDKDNYAIGTTASEIAVILAISLIDEISTQLTLERKLENRYKRDTVTINANIAKATHGETKQEVLGSGDPSQQHQEFVLKEKPLTFISAPTLNGVKSTLEIRINEVLWKEVQSLYTLGPNDRAYAVRIENDGRVRIIFGDGIKGALIHADSENVTAKYRVGIGKSGKLKKDQLSLLMSRPLGVRGVINIDETNGFDDAEDLEQGRVNAPLTVLTIDRIVSLSDFENFAKAFAGIGKAQAIWIWDGEKKKVHISIASANGGVIDSHSELFNNLVEAINTFKDPVLRFSIESFSKLTFDLKANILVKGGEKERENIFSIVRDTLNAKFSFASREFGQPVTVSEVMSAIQQVKGVVAVDMNYLCRSDKKEETCISSIPSSIAHWDDAKGGIVPAELLVLNPEGLHLGVMAI